MTDMREIGRRRHAASADPGTTRVVRAALAAAALLLAAALAGACARRPPAPEPAIRTTKAFDAIFGELPTPSGPGRCYATVAYFPSAREPGKVRPAPIFTAEPGQEERLSVRTVVRGIADAGAFSAAAAPAFPAGSDLGSFSIEGGVARIAIAGPFRAADLPAPRREAAARALALTVAQFGKAREVDVTDAAGTARFRGTADEAAVVDIGPPEILGLLAVKDKADRPATVLSVLFDRPVFVEEIAFYPPGRNDPVPGAVYATGFGMRAELHPDRAVSLETRDAWRVRLTVRDGKGRRTLTDRTWKVKEVMRD